MEYSQIIAQHFRNVFQIHPEDSIRLAKVYEIWKYGGDNGKFNEFKVDKGKRMIWIGVCPAENMWTIWSDDSYLPNGSPIPEGVIWHCLFCGHEKQPPNVDPNFPDKTIPVKPIIPIGSAK